ncbi:MAG TPA: hypothetical protein VGL24_07840 [Chthoniobacterales bacterium]|jgi:hypothetical protein
MANSRPASRLEDDICIHIFTVSAGMVGVCLTVIGLLRVVITLRRADTFADNLLAIDAFLFLISCLASYWTLRTRTNKRMYLLERFADLVFICALLLMVAVCAFVAFAMAVTH